MNRRNRFHHGFLSGVRGHCRFCARRMVSAPSYGDLAAVADHVGGVSALKMDQENAAPDAGKQHLPPKNQKSHKLPASDPDKVVVLAEQPEEERPPGEPAPTPQRRALRGHKHLLAEKPRVKAAAKQLRARFLRLLTPLLLRPLLLPPSTAKYSMPPPSTLPPSTVPCGRRCIPCGLFHPQRLSCGHLRSRCHRGGQHQRRPPHCRLRRHCVRSRRSGRRHPLRQIRRRHRPLHAPPHHALRAGP